MRSPALLPSIATPPWPEGRESLGADLCEAPAAFTWRRAMTRSKTMPGQR